MENTKENKMGTESILKLIITMSLPSIFSMLVQALYNIVDSIFISHYSENALTAVSLAFPVQMLMMSLAIGTAIGVNSLVSRRLGEKRFDAANNAATHGMVLAFLSWCAVALLGAFLIRPYFSMFRLESETLQYACDYTSIVVIGSFGLFLQIAVEKILQATGNMIIPMVLMLIGSITNVILDPIMIFGYLGFPAMGAAGAALATICGQLLAMIVSLVFLFAKKHDVSIHLKGFCFHRETISEIYRVGIPSIIMQSIGSVMVSVFNLILATFSELAVTVLGVYYKLQSFVFMPVFGLTHGLMPIMGYSFGARNRARLNQAIKLGCIFSFSIMVVGTLLFFVVTKPLLMIFNADAALLDIGIPALRIISICFPSAGISIVLSTLFQAVGEGRFSLYISAFRQLLFLLPAAYLLSKIGLFYVWFSFPIAEVAALVFTLALFRYMNRTTFSYL